MRTFAFFEAHNDTTEFSVKRLPALHITNAGYDTIRKLRGHLIQIQ